jgi:hypothetical protein
VVGRGRGQGIRVSKGRAMNSARGNYRRAPKPVAPMEINDGQGVVVGDGNNQYNQFGDILINQPDFCSCGNRIQFQCQRCGKGLCKGCDVIEFPKPVPPPTVMHRQESARRLVVPVQGFGYLETSLRGGACWAVTADRIVGLPPVNAGFIGPLLHVEDILPHLRWNSGGIHHLCCGCLNSGLQRTIEAISDGESCEHPSCGATPVQRCPCCGEAYCGEHAVGFSCDTIASCHMCTFERMDRFEKGTAGGSRRGGIGWPRKRGGSVKAQTRWDVCERDRCFDKMVNSLTAPPGSAMSIYADIFYEERIVQEFSNEAERGKAEIFPSGYYKLIRKPG